MSTCFPWHTGVLGGMAAKLWRKIPLISCLLLLHLDLGLCANPLLDALSNKLLSLKTNPTHIEIGKLGTGQVGRILLLVLVSYAFGSTSSSDSSNSRSSASSTSKRR